MVPAWFSLPQVIVTLDGKSVEKIIKHYFSGAGGRP